MACTYEADNDSWPPCAVLSHWLCKESENWEESDISESQGIVVSKMNSATAMPPSQGGFSMGTMPAGNASFLAPDENEEKVPF